MVLLMHTFCPGGRHGELPRAFLSASVVVDRRKDTASAARVCVSWERTRPHVENNRSSEDLRTTEEPSQYPAWRCFSGHKIHRRRRPCSGEDCHQKGGVIETLIE
mmetsp:Transcript_17546/g.34940  ORF Transcript_17546/g.34940 Transcript_17546/m.34940 type:complete len:105 (+) Transcript_17546:109-423(+)